MAALDLSPYVPIDRRHSLLAGMPLPERSVGAALFADISGFTPLAAALAAELGRPRGAEELLNYLNPLQEALISQVHAYRGSVIGFVGDAITCWFDGGIRSDLREVSRRGLACAMAMQAHMPRFAQVSTPKGTQLSISIKVAIAAGPARRFLVGRPDQLYFEALAGATLERMAAAERQAQKGEIVASQEVADSLGQELRIAAWRREPGRSFAVVQALNAPPAPKPWPPLPAGALGVEQLRSWVIPAVYERLLSSGSFMAELRPTTPLFVKFGNIDYDGDDEAGDKLNSYICWVQDVLARQAGTLLQLTIGDKGSFLYASFGAPIAHEVDAQHAAAAAVELRDLPAELRHIGPVQIGISRGLSWTGACGGRAACTYGVISDEVNVAARLMAQAAPGQILVSRDVAEASAGQYHYTTLGEIPLKGKDEPLAVSELVARQANSARRPATLFASPLLGRQAHLERLHGYLAAASRGQGQVVQIEGAAGVGKSHLVAAFSQQAAGHGWHVLWGNCQRFAQGTTYEPWRQIFQDLTSSGRSAGSLDLSGPADLPGLADWALRSPLLGDLLGLPIPDNEMTAALEPRLRQQALTALVTDIIQALAGRKPLLVLLDDAHWLDEASAKLTLAVARALGHLPAMLVAMHRPPQALTQPILPELASLAYHHHLLLDELSPDDAAALASRRLQGELSPLVRALIVVQGHGNPFFTEELADALREAGHIQCGEGGKWALSQPTFDAMLDSNCLVKAEGEWQLADKLSLCAAALDIPSSIHAAVLARLDRLPEAYKLTLKVASVIGRVFGMDLLQAIHPARPDAVRLREEVEAVRQRDLVRVDVDAPEPAYLFKHNITHEVAYGTLLFAQRQQLHTQAAKWYEQSYGGSDSPQQIGLDSALAPHYAVLAHHWRGAGNDERERVYAGLAAQQAAYRYANESALCYFSRALELTPESETESYYHLLLGREAVEDVMGLREAQAQDLAALATLAEALQDKPKRAVAHLRQATYERSLDHYPAALEAVQQAVAQAEQAGDLLTRMRGIYEWGRILWKQSDYQAARDQLELALELARASQNAQEEANSLYDLGTILYEQANYAAARARYEQALAIYQDAGHRPGSLQCRLMFGAIHYKAGEYTAAQAHYEQALALARSIGWLYSEAFILASLGDNHFDLGDYAGAASYHEQALAISREIGHQDGEIASLDTLGLVSTMQGDWATALAYGQQALAIERDIEDRYSQGYTLNHLGLAWDGLADAEAARQAFSEALSVRRELELEPQALDDMAGLARAAQALEDVGQARGYVDEILAWLASNPPDGIEFPILVYLTCYHVLQADAGGDPSTLLRARSVWEEGHALLQARAGRIQDTALREQFLHDVPFNRELMNVKRKT